MSACRAVYCTVPCCYLISTVPVHYHIGVQGLLMQIMPQRVWMVTLRQEVRTGSVTNPNFPAIHFSSSSFQQSLIIHLDSLHSSQSLLCTTCIASSHLTGCQHRSLIDLPYREQTYPEANLSYDCTYPEFSPSPHPPRCCGIRTYA